MSWCRGTTAATRRYIAMELRRGMQRFRFDVSEGPRGRSGGAGNTDLSVTGSPIKMSLSGSGARHRLPYSRAEAGERVTQL